MHKFIAIIPARYASTRFPGKPLALLGGKPMVQHVYERVSNALDEVLVATDDERIATAVKAFGGNVAMTSSEHRSGTDRCLEAYRRSGSTADVVINIQGDEPFIHPEQIAELCACFDDPNVLIATLVRPFDASRGYDELADPNTPKVVMDSEMNALYFSRSVIPYTRGADVQHWPERTAYYTHVGMYGYTAATLGQITALPQSPLEIAESLEQLRWLQAGYKIRTALTRHSTIGIDTPADLERAEQMLRSQNDVTL